MLLSLFLDNNKNNLFILYSTIIISDQGKIPLAMITTMKKLKSGYINGTRVSLGNLSEFLSTSCITNLSFLGSSEDGRPDKLNPQVNKYFCCKLIYIISYFIYIYTYLIRSNNI